MAATEKAAIRVFKQTLSQQQKRGIIVDYPQELIENVLQRSTGMRLEGFVAGQGPLQPKLMIVGEAPGRNEIANHIPFSGQAGVELMNCLAVAGLTRDEVYITSAVRSRPFSIKERLNKRTGQIETIRPNRTPTKKEVLAHAPILDYEIRQVKPPLIVTVGNIGLQRLLGPNHSITEEHGQLFSGPIQELTADKTGYRWTKTSYQVIPLFHPAAVFYNRKLAAAIKADWQQIGRLLQ